MSNDFSQFPPELDVHYEGKYLTFKSPVHIKQDVKDKLRAIQPQEGSVIIMQKPRNGLTFQLRGGNEKIRLEMLKFVLSNTLDKEGNPLFNQDEVIPFSIKYLKYMNYKITEKIKSSDLKNDDFKDLDIDYWLSDDVRVKDYPSFDKFKECPMDIDYIMLNIIMKLFSNKNDFAKFDDLKNDEEKDKKIIVILTMPITLQVAIERTSVGKYKLTFADNGKIKADKIRYQIEKLIIPTIEQYKALTVICSKSDPVEENEIRKMVDELKIENLETIVIQDEHEINEDLATSYVIYLLHDMTDDIKNQLKKVSEEYYKKIQLVKCSTCHCFYCPNQEGEKCITGEHKGKQIPFETGEMEQVDFDDDEEPFILINMDCCGEVIKDDNDIENCCVKVEHGPHIEDKNSDVHSEIEFIEEIPKDEKK